MIRTRMRERLLNSMVITYLYHKDGIYTSRCKRKELDMHTQETGDLVLPRYM